ncbi:MAG: tRNA uridine-5-carboxymethylaminomethyl(34) synthesis GTPase MnmE [Candidatus Margulisbacteria bacterium]|nr:tRNA uridine-5-carboxymethylaminomethyl(34) synthesis GTPase MnmE [Candidatus Margulisiibacteriota bacterium]
MSLNSFSDVIAAISTPPGRSGIAVIRLSGQDVLAFIKPFLSLKKYEPNTIKFSVFKKGQEVLDEVLVSYFKAPKSFTGEDMIEINCHGNYVVAKKILNLLFQNGARSAQPGEFTMRALVNGKMDLVQAEAVIDLIDAKTAIAAKVSSAHLQGSLSEEIAQIRQKVLDMVSHIEVHLDYPEEEELSDKMHYVSILEEIRVSIDGLLVSFSKGKIYKDGLVVAITGKPNAGKSSLFNKWLEDNRAIVSDIPGTTRDTIEEWIELEGIPIKLVDTAGIRESKDEVEKMGIGRTKEYLAKADIVIVMLDASTGIVDSDELLLEDVIVEKTMFLINKTDIASADKVNSQLLERHPESDIFSLSVLHDNNLDDFNVRLIKKIEYLFKVDNEAEILINNERHQESLLKAKEAVLAAEDSVLAGATEDLWVIDLKEAMVHLGQVVGEDVSEEVLDNIFSRFCVGK